MSLIHEDGMVMSNKEAQDKIRKTLQRHGKFILSAQCPPPIGYVAEFAGLPMRIVKFVSKQEAERLSDSDIWGEVEWDSDAFYFEVVVAD